MLRMASIGWLSLFIIFLITFILFSMTNYYSLISKTPKSEISSKYSTTSLNWNLMTNFSPYLTPHQVF